MTTLRRERIQKFAKIFSYETIFRTLLAQHYHNTNNPSPSELEKMVNDYIDIFIEKLADASISRSEAQAEYKTTEVVGIEASMFQDRPTTQADITPAKIEHEAIIAFEASFGVQTEKGQMLAWYKGKPEWTKLRKFVVEVYQEDNKCFEKYKVWRTTSYVKGAVSLKEVQRDPSSFMLSWVTFTEAVKPVESNNQPRKFERLNNE